MERFIFDKIPGDKDTSAAEEAANDRLHNDDLFDQDETAAGERVNEATGEPIDNSTYTGMEDLVVTDSLEDQGTKDSEDDAAEVWLRENDPNHPRYTGRK